MVIVRLYTEVFLMYMHGYCGYCGYQWLCMVISGICMVVLPEIEIIY